MIHPAATSPAAIPSVSVMKNPAMKMVRRRACACAWLVVDRPTNRR